MDFLVRDITKHFEGKYDYLKTLEVIYNSGANTCSISFLYPESIKEFSDEEKKAIADYVRQKLSLNAQVVVKFKKSYLDDRLLLREIQNFFRESYASIFPYVKEDIISLDKSVGVGIKLRFAPTVVAMVDSKRLQGELEAYMSKHFCADFACEVVADESLNEDVDVVGERMKKFDFVQPKKVKRYTVKDVSLVVGKECYPEPEYIENIKGEKQAVILAGRIENYTRKTFIKKGKKEREKAYYTFVLNEGRKRINAIYFSSLANEAKMNKLADGDSVIVVGDVRNGYGGLTVHISSLGLCEIPEDIYEVKEEPSVVSEVKEGYFTVMPEEIVALSQATLFGEARPTSQHVLQNKFVVFDVETTGLDPESCEIIEIGACKIENGIIKEKFQTLIKPKQEISYLITDITGITNDMVEDAPSGEDVVRDFYNFTRGCIMVGHNVGFDIKFIKKAGEKVGLDFDNEIEDTMTLAREKIRVPNYKLKTIVKTLGLELVNAHRAFNDAYATAQVYLKLSELA